MQGERRQLIEADRALIEQEKIHTSMSVGDLIQDTDGTFWECAPEGWRKLAKDDDPSKWDDPTKKLPPQIPRSERVIIAGQPRPQWFVER